jgi:HK97 family phage major capsid protein
MRIRYVNGVPQVVEGGGAAVEIVGNDDEPIVERSLDFSSEVAPLTEAERRTRLAALRSQVEAPRRELFLARARFGKDAILTEELRALGGSGAAGDYLTYQEFQDRVFSAQKAADAITSPDVITVITTKTGTPFPIPLSDDTSGVADVTAENAALSTSDLVFEQLMLPACSKVSTPMWKWSLEMVQDTGVDIESFLVEKAGPRLARKEGALLEAALAAGATQGVSAGASAIVPANIWDLYGSIDPSYIASAKCAWLMRESTFIAISKLVDTAGLPVFPVRRDPAGNFELLAHPVRFCPSVAAIGTTNKSVFFGDASALILRRQRDSFRITRYDELFATSGNVGFSGFERISVGFAKASTADSPVKYLQHS